MCFKLCHPVMQNKKYNIERQQRERKRQHHLVKSFAFAPQREKCRDRKQDQHITRQGSQGFDALRESEREQGDTQRKERVVKRQTSPSDSQDRQWNEREGQIERVLCVPCTHAVCVEQRTNVGEDTRPGQREVAVPAKSGFLRGEQKRVALRHIEENHIGGDARWNQCYGQQRVDPLPPRMRSALAGHPETLDIENQKRDSQDDTG